MSLQTPVKKYASLEQVNALGILKVEVTNPSTLDYTSLLESIDLKLDDLALIKAELITANGTLTSISGDTTAIKSDTSAILTQVTDTNAKLEDVKTKLDSQITLLGDLKTEIQSTNTKLDTANATLTTISGDIATIKTDISAIKSDISAIKTDVASIKTNTDAIKTAVESIDTKLDTVITSLSSIETKLDTIHDDLVTINGTLQAEFDETQVALQAVEDAILATQDTFQVVDCDGNDVGTPETVQKTVVLNKVIASICNDADIVDPIVTAIENQTTALQVARTHDLLQTPPMPIGGTITIPSSKFATMSILAIRGEFTVANTANDFSADVSLSTGTIVSSIEISEDGNGTASGSTSVPQGLDTRSNANDLDKAGNAYIITAVRANSVLQLDLYK